MGLSLGKAPLPPVCSFICHGVVLAVEMCVLECLERMRVQEGLWREDRAGEHGVGEPGPRSTLYAVREVEAGVGGSNASQVLWDVSGGVSGHEP